MDFWDEAVITPIKKQISKEQMLPIIKKMEIGQLLLECEDTEIQKYILHELESVYRDYCLGKWNDAYIQDIISRLMSFDQIVGMVIPKLDLVETAFSWASQASVYLRGQDFINLMTSYEFSIGHKDWDALEQRVNQELLKLKVYGDSHKGEYLSLMHAYIQIRRAANHNTEKQTANLYLLLQHWDFLKLVYSVILRKIVGCGHRDFAAVANNIFVQKDNYKFIHIFYAVAKERIDDLCETEKQREQINRHLDKLQKEMQKTPQDNDTLDGLSKILFTSEFQVFLERNSMKSYDEIVSELSEMKAKVDSLNTQVENMARQMAAAVNAAIPVEDIEQELLRLLPGAAYDVFTHVNSLLTGNKAWGERAAGIKEHILNKRETPTVAFTKVEIRHGGTNIDKNYGPNIEHNGGTLALPDNNKE